MWNKSVRQVIDGFVKDGVHGYLPTITPICGPTTDPVINIQMPDGSVKQVLQFACGNYLGLARDPRVVGVTVDALWQYGLTASGSRWGCGTQDVHVNTEKLLADFQGEEDSAIFFLTTLASQAVIPNIVEVPMLANYIAHMGLFTLPDDEDTTIFIDWFTHASVKWACRIPKGISTRSYPHCDMDALEDLLKRSKAKRKIIATDGIFSAQGDVAPLPEIVFLAEKYGAMILVDDAHGTGTIGRTGRGTWEHFGVERQIDIKIGSLAKTLAIGFGSFVAGDANFITYLRTNGFSYVFSGSPPPDRLIGLAKALEIARTEHWRREKMMANAKYIRDGLVQRGLPTLSEDQPLTPIIPIILGDEFLSNAIVNYLLMEEGVYTSSFVYPAVPEGQGRVRLTVMSTHEREHLDHFLQALDRALERFPINIKH